MPHTIAVAFDTNQWVQCRNKRPFLAQIIFSPIPKRGLSPSIDCPHCARGYYLQPNGEWISDRLLQFLNDNEVEEAKRRAI